MIIKNIVRLLIITQCAIMYPMQPHELGGQIMPVNWLQKEQINLLVQIPKTFKSVQPIDFRPMREFILQTDIDADHWSEIITTNLYTGRKLPAANIVTLIRNGISSTATDIHLIEFNTTSHGHYDSAELIMAYTHHARREFVHARYFSGPADCSGAQYSVWLNHMSEAEAQLKTTAFFKHNVEVYNKPISEILKILSHRLEKTA